MSRTRTTVKPLTFFVLVIVGILATAHILATLAFTGPTTALKTSLQPALNKYFLGPLDQGWSLFAPGPYSQDEYFMVQACLSTAEICAKGSEGGAEITEWRDVTAEEMLSVPGNIFANRESKQSKVIHGRLWPTISDLDETHANEIANTFVSGEEVFGMDLYSAQARKTVSSAELDDMRSYKRMEDVAIGFASLYAKETWGEVSSVRVQLRRDPVIPFAQRNNPDATTKSTFRHIGWRDVKAFDESTVSAWS